MKHKSYNPFKLWLSYVGAGLMGSLVLLGILMGGYGVLIGLIPSYLIVSKIFNLIPENIGIFLFILLAISQIILGFLVGWGLHSLIRKLTKGKI